MGFSRFYWVLLGFTRFYWILPGFTRLYEDEGGKESVEAIIDDLDTKIRKKIHCNACWINKNRFFLRLEGWKWIKNPIKTGDTVNGVMNDRYPNGRRTFDQKSKEMEINQSNIFNWKTIITLVELFLRTFFSNFKVKSTWKPNDNILSRHCDCDHQS